MSAAAGLIGAIISALGAGASSLIANSASNSQNELNYFYMLQQMYMQQMQFNEEMNFQEYQFNKNLDFSNRQLQSQIDIANKNYEMEQQNYLYNQGLNSQMFNYQKDLNALQMQREDTAMQRQVADLVKAGFSPLAAIGGNGAAAGALSTASMNNLQAPNFDGSGIANASSQYLNLAQQYASLHSQLYSKNAEQKQAAAFAIAQMKQDLHFKNQSLATEVFNSAVNARNKSLQNKSLQEDITTKQYANKWYEEHGYSQTTLATVLSDFLNRDDVKQAKEKFMNILSNGLSAVSDGLKSLSDSVSSAIGKNDFKFSASENKEMLNELSEAESDFVFNWLKNNNKSLSEMTLSDWLDCAAAEKKARKRK